MTSTISMSRLRAVGASLALLASLGATLGSAQAAYATAAPTHAPANAGKALALARSLASAAAQAETRTPTTDRVALRRVVEPVLQSVIISAGQPPAEVQMALRVVLKDCSAEHGVGLTIDGAVCPGHQGSYDALQDLLRTVTALIDQEAQPTGGDASHGAAAFGSVSGGVASGGGPDYRQPS